MTEQERKLRNQAFLDHSKGWEASLLKNAREDFEAGLLEALKLIKST